MDNKSYFTNPHKKIKKICEILFHITLILAIAGVIISIFASIITEEIWILLYSILIGGFSVWGCYFTCLTLCSIADINEKIDAIDKKINNSNNNALQKNSNTSTFEMDISNTMSDG